MPIPPPLTLIALIVFGCAFAGAQELPACEWCGAPETPANLYHANGAGIYEKWGDEVDPTRPNQCAV